MTTPDVRRLRAFLARHLGSGGFALDVLRHEVGAVTNRNRLTGGDEGLSTFNTDQLAWVVLHREELGAGHPCIAALGLSAAIEGRWPLWREIVASGVLPTDWVWMGWAEGFTGDEDELLGRLGAIADARVRCGAASVAVETAAAAVGGRLLAMFLRRDVGSVYHRLLAAGLKSAKAGALADTALAQLGSTTEVLFIGDVDLTLAELVRRCDGDPERHAELLDRVAGEHTTVARAHRRLRSGDAARALRLVRDHRLLSPAFPQAMVVAALAALEVGDLRQARTFVERVEDAPMRLKIRCRVANAAADVDGELSTLVELNELAPEDADAFVQLVGVVERLDQHQLSRHLCLQAQERFYDRPEVMAFIRRRLV